MSDTSTPTTRPAATDWQRLPDADPIRVRDPLAELLGMVAEGDPLVVTFADVATAAGHACPAVAGAYRATQLALDDLYPDALPVRSEVAVRVGDDPDAPGVGPMAHVVEQVTGAADETGFTGFGGYGGRQHLLTFDPIDAAGRAFEFTRRDTDDTVRVTFSPADAGVDPDAGGGPPMETIPRLVEGDATPAERERFLDAWHDRVQRILRAPAGDDSPFTVTSR